MNEQTSVQNGYVTGYSFAVANTHESTTQDTILKLPPSSDFKDWARVKTNSDGKFRLYKDFNNYISIQPIKKGDTFEYICNYRSIESAPKNIDDIFLPAPATWSLLAPEDSEKLGVPSICMCTTEQEALAYLDDERVNLSPRFLQSKEIFVSVADGATQLTENDKGQHISILQQALVDAGFLDDVTGVYDKKTVNAIATLKNKISENQKMPLDSDGTFLDKTYFDVINEQYLNEKDSIEWERISNADGALPNKRLLDADEVATSSTILKTSQTSESLQADAPNTIMSSKKDLLLKNKDLDAENKLVILMQEQIKGYTRGLAREAAPVEDITRKYEAEANGNLESNSPQSITQKSWLLTPMQMERVAVLAQMQILGTFGKFIPDGGGRIKPYKYGENLFDKWENDMNPPLETDSAQLSPIEQEQERKAIKIRRIMHAYKAILYQRQIPFNMIPTSNTIEKEYISNYRNRLLTEGDAVNVLFFKAMENALMADDAFFDNASKVAASFPGRAIGDSIYMHRYTRSDKPDFSAYGLFYTALHETLHTLEHPQFEIYCLEHLESQDITSLQEGITDFLTGLVATNTANIGDLLQKENILAGRAVAWSPSYPADIRKVRQLVGVIGLDNLFAAYFKGEMDYMRLK